MHFTSFQTVRMHSRLKHGDPTSAMATAIRRIKPLPSKDASGRSLKDDDEEAARPATRVKLCSASGPDVVAAAWTRASPPIIAAPRLLVFMGREIRIPCYPIERRAECLHACHWLPSYTAGCVNRGPLTRPHSPRITPRVTPLITPPLLPGNGSCISCTL